MPKIRIDLHKTARNTVGKLYRDLEESNKLWYDTIGLVITFASSVLVLTTALANKLFLETKGLDGLSAFVVIAWVLLFLSIVSGIMAKLNGSISFANLANDSVKVLKQCYEKISEGKDVDEIDIGGNFIIPSNIFWGAASINLFIVALVFLCLAFLKRAFSMSLCITTIGISVALLIVINIYLLNKRKVK